ncbi:hypothetical protein HY604_03390 [Candidatus Peregrinibacteria bacterium]|nr:hypothetical protein [Candidatus Peregrinibacteria bacterium]
MGKVLDNSCGVGLVGAERRFECGAEEPSKVRQKVGEVVRDVCDLNVAAGLPYKMKLSEWIAWNKEQDAKA